MWCSYHSSFVYGGLNVYYSVIPDQGGACSVGCGSDPDPLNNLYSVISHELAEVVTNPAVGIAQSIGYPLAWWSPIFGEIADACGEKQAQVTLGDGRRYTVHQLWSNSQRACVQPA
jgi:hypothetical protein